MTIVSKNGKSQDAKAESMVLLKSSLKSYTISLPQDTIKIFQKVSLYTRREEIFSWCDGLVTSQNRMWGEKYAD